MVPASPSLAACSVFAHLEEVTLYYHSRNRGLETLPSIPQNGNCIHGKFKFYRGLGSEKSIPNKAAMVVASRDAQAEFRHEAGDFSFGLSHSQSLK